MRPNVATAIVSILLGCIVILLFHISQIKEHEHNPTHIHMEEKESVEKFQPKLDFIPQTHGYHCEDLFKGTPAEKYNMTPLFHQYEKEYWDVAIKNGRFPEEEYRALHFIGKHKFIKTVCETGFHKGGSSFHHLTANDKAEVHSFELGGGLFKESVAKWLSKIFSTRFSIHLGDSTKTVPEFARQNPDFRCDFMYVDGGHVYPVAKADIINFSHMANLKNNFIAFDDYPPGWEDIGKAWEESLADGTIKELMRCSYKNFPGTPRGFVVGVVVKHPNGSKN